MLRRLSHGERCAAALMVLVSVSAVVAALVAMAVVDAAGRAKAVREAGAHHQTVATVVDVSAATGPGPVAVGALPTDYSARVRWQWDHQVHVGSQSVVSALPAGATTMVWVDNSGQLTTKPWTASDTASAVITVGVAGLVMAVGVTVLAWLVFSRWLLARRARLWQADWDRVAPTWTRRTGIS